MVPISPDEILLLSELEEKRVENIESDIDNYLRNNFKPSLGTDRVMYDLTNEIRALRDVALNKMLDDYRHVGWKVEVKHSQREGSWIDFRRGDLK